jgi:hypothetical protein
MLVWRCLFCMRRCLFYMKRIISILLLFLFTQVVFGQTLSNIDRIRIAEAFQLGEKFSDKVWKDWSKAPFGVLLVTPETEFLIRHSSPSKDFAEIGDDKLLKSKVYRRKQFFNPSFLATFPAVGGISTIVVGQAENTFVKTSTPWAVTLLHEHFHQFQNSQPTYFEEVNGLGLANGDTSGMWMLNYAFPYSDKTIQEKFEKLCKMLAEILETSEKNVTADKLNHYLTARKDFQNTIKANDYKYFSFQVWQEGVAHYTEYKIAKSAAKNYKPGKEFSQLKDFTPYRTVADDLLKNILNDLKTVKFGESQRVAFYSFGAGEALLLDKVNPNWKTRYNSERFYLEKYFEK